VKFQKKTSVVKKNVYNQCILVSNSTAGTIRQVTHIVSHMEITYNCLFCPKEDYAYIITESDIYLTNPLYFIDY
jgi:hypothetical protein